MFFKWPSKSKPPASGVPTGPDETEVQAARPAAEAGRAHTSGPYNAHTALGHEALRRITDAKSLGFKTTAEITPASGLIGQERALGALSFGLSMKAPDYNVFVLGPAGCGKRTAIKAQLASEARGRTPLDWVYVNNFDDPTKPKALALPAGRGKALKHAMTEALRELAVTLPYAFESEDYQARRRAIEEEHRSGQDDALSELSERAARQNVALLRTPLGFAMAPMHEGKVVKPEVFNQLPQSMRREVEARVAVLQKELETTLASAPKADKLRRRQVTELNEDVARAAVESALDEVSAQFADLPDVARHLAMVEADLVANALAIFGVEAAGPGGVLRELSDPATDPRLRRYMVNVLVAHEAGDNAPVIDESYPTIGTLTGRVEHVAQMGALVTDFLLIKPGALHRANGGFLVIDAGSLRSTPRAAEALKRALKSRRITVELPAEALPVGVTQTLEPEPIPLDLKVILVGVCESDYALLRDDTELAHLFKVKAEFDDTMRRSKEADAAYARLIASIVATHELRPVSSDGVARLIEEGARLAEDSERVSIDVGRITDIVREADYWAGQEQDEVIGRRNVVRAISEHVQRADRLRDQTHEGFERGIALIDTEGTRTGQINGLSLQQARDFAFGRPTRITARVHLGSGHVTDIEHEAKLGGPLHSKGVMILWGFLAGRFGQEVPLKLGASLVFEQSYTAVEGDSASAAELFALLSALADVPIRQDIAVTGSVNQWGEVQAVSGVNQKIEGFFDVCQTRGLTGKQGVIIPRANIQHLMLREDVVDSAREKWFSVFAIGTVDEGLALLTGLEAGERGADGRYPSNSINGRIEAKLALFAERARTFSIPQSRDAKPQVSSA